MLELSHTIGISLASIMLGMLIELELHPLGRLTRKLRQE